MWLVAGMMFAVTKSVSWLTRGPGNANVFRHIAYLFAWPGMNADAFLFRQSPTTPTPANWLFAFGKLIIGITLCWVIARQAYAFSPLICGWIAMAGIAFTLHFGLFHLLANFWQLLGYDARPIMNWPVLSRRLTEFWGQRWNLAFRDLTHKFLFSPFSNRAGAKWALLLGFLVSGIIHDLVISWPAGGGWGLPTAYFVIQAIGIAIERTRTGRRIAGRRFTALVLVAPALLLFHEPFVVNVVIPFARSLEALP